MNVLDRINNYNLRHTFDPNIVILKKGTNKTHQISILVVPLKQEQTEEIHANQSLSEDVIEFLKQQKHITKLGDIAEVNFCGKLDEFKAYDRVVVQLPMRKSDFLKGVEPSYRYYVMTIERQKELLPMNVCSSARLSWLSAIKKCGSPFGLLIKIKIPLDD